MTRNDAPAKYTALMLQNIISKLNEIKCVDGTKKYQDDIFSSGIFGIFCPVLHQIIYPEFNFSFFPSGSDVPGVIYIFEGAERLALISWRIPQGSPIVAAATKTVLAKKEGFNGRKMFGQAMDFVRSTLNHLPPSATKIDRNEKPMLICGKKNFANFVQSDMPTIDKIISEHHEMQIYITWDPFNLCMKPPYSGKLNFIEHHNAFHRWSSSLIFTGTTTFLTNKVRSRFLQSAINEKKPSKSKIYITVRPNVAIRCLINQIDFLSCLIQEFHHKYNELEFVLDGFSMPEKWSASMHDESTRREFIDRVEQSDIAIRELIRTLPDAEKNITNITGRKLSDALEIISSCSYYVCHAGTQQHKIGWLFPRYGFVHSNSHRIGDGNMKRHASQAECSIVPSGPLPHCIEDLVILYDGKSRHPKNRDYIITDINFVTNQIIQDYARNVMEEH